MSKQSHDAQRLYQVMDKSLQGREWLANNEYSIADMAAFPWVLCHRLPGDHPFFPNLSGDGRVYMSSL